jgi:hypothetical protein
MSVKFVVYLSLSVVLVSSRAFAQEPSPIVISDLRQITLAAFPQIAPVVVTTAPAERPSKTLVSLDVSFAALQAIDLHSTFAAKAAGAGYERNPIASALVDRPAAFIAFKSATTVGMIYLSHEVAKRNKAAAVFAMIGMNTAYGVVAWHNYSIARGR